MAQGSHNSTTVNTANHCTGQGHKVRERLSTMAVSSIQNARCAGTPQPEKTAYAPPSTTAPTLAATGTGTVSRSLGQRRPSVRQIQPIAVSAIHANKVMCMPDTTTKCVTPVRRNTSQSSRLMADWSPATKAANTPAALLG